MRQLLVQVPRGHGRQVVEKAKTYHAINVAQFEATRDGEPLDLVLLHLSNRKVGPLIEQLHEIAQLRITFSPQGVFALTPPPQEAPDQVKDVEFRSPIEVFLSGFQSIGSWKGFLGYAAVAGVVVWSGLYTNTTYLLTASMLIAPFAGPAMNAAIGTASGEGRLLRQSLLRYAGALAVTIAVAGVLSLILRQEIATPQMIDRSKVSAVAVLLPLAAGAAGAFHLFQSERNSLVSGAAVGVLVAASLAPPAGVVGMAAAIGEWSMVLNAGYVLVLQLIGINFSGALLFRLLGLSTEHTRYRPGSRRLFRLALALTTAALVGLLTLQFSIPVELERSSLEQQAVREIYTVLREREAVLPVEVTARFTRSDIPGQHTLLGDVYVQHRGPAEELRTRLTNRVQQHLGAVWPHITPLVNVNVLNPPAPP